MTNSNPISWVEIPVKDIDRAILFYNTIMGWKMEKQIFGDTLMAWFPNYPTTYGSSGSLIQHKSDYIVSDTKGALVYFKCKDISETLSKIDLAGGKIVQGKTLINKEHGYMSIVLDSEGNRIALHSAYSEPFKKVLVLCTGNSCRSQMAEGFINAYGEGQILCKSAGLIAKGVNPRAASVMKELGIDISVQTSNPIDDFIDEKFDLILTVCDHAKENCPIFPSTTQTIHHSFDDPDGVEGNDEVVLEKFRKVRDEIDLYSKKLVQSLI